MKNEVVNDMKHKFTNTYKTDGWWMGDGESKSGLGSSLRYTQNFRRELVNLLEHNNITNIFDCACGDWNWMRTIQHKLPNYTGNDIVEDMISINNQQFGSDNITFKCGDMLSSLNEYGDSEIDLIICRHTLEHLPMEYSIKVIVEMKKKSKYAIITSTNTVSQNLDINMDGVSATGLNLELHPYIELLGLPIYKFYDSIYPVKEFGCFAYLYEF